MSHLRVVILLYLLIPLEGYASTSLVLDYVPKTHEREIARAQVKVRAFPEVERSYVELADAFLRTGEGLHRRYAAIALDVARRKGEESVAAQVLRARLDMDKHAFGSARRRMLRTIKAHPAHAEALLVLGDAALELGRYDEALEHHQTALALSPDLRTYNRGGYLRMLHGDAEGAREMLMLALEAGSWRDTSSLAWCWVDLGTLSLRLGNLVRAAAESRNALKLAPGYEPALRLQAQVSQAHKAWEEAERQLRVLVKRFGRAEDRFTLAEVLHHQGRSQAAARLEAEAMLKAAHVPRVTSLYLSRRYGAGRASEAEAWALKSLAKRSDIYSYYALALARAHGGRLQEAKQALRKARRLGTMDIEFKRLDERITLALQSMPTTPKL